MTEDPPTNPSFPGSSSERGSGPEGGDQRHDDTGPGDERTFRFLVENAREAIIVVAPDGTILYFNRALSEQIGVPSEDLHGRPLTSVLHLADALRQDPAPEIRRFTRRPHEPAARPRSAQRRRESVLLLPNGREMPVEVSFAAFTWMGQPANAVFLRDLSRQRRADRALRESEERWRAIASVLPDLVLVMDEDGRYVEVLAVNETLLYHPAAVLKGRLMRETLPADMAELFLNTVRLTIEHGLTRTLEYSLPLEDGEHWFEGRSALLGRVIDGKRCVVWVARDITERKRAEAARERQHRFIRDLVDAIPNPVFVKDREHRFLLLNDAMCEFVGRSREELLGYSDFDFFPEQEARWFVEKDEEVLISGTPNVVEESLTPAAGRARWILTRKTAGLGPDGNPILIGSFSDLTERRQAEEELRRRDRVLEAVNFAAERLVRAETWEEVIGEILERIGSSAGVSQVFLCENRFVDGEIHTVWRQSWEDPSRGVCSWNPSTKGYPLLRMGFAPLAETLKAGQVLAIPLAEYPERLRQIFEERGIRSIVAVPVLVEGEWWGMLGFAESATGHCWAAAETDALRVAGNMLGAFIRRQRTREALRRSEERFHDVATAAGEFIWEIDAEAKVIFSSERVLEVLGYSPEELSRLSPFDIMPPDESSRVRAAHERAVAVQREFRNKEVRIRTRSGREIWINVSGLPILGPQGEHLGYRGVAQDITERKRAEEELRRRDSILEAMNIAAGRLLQSQTWTECIDEILARLGGATGVSRVSFYSIGEPQPGELVAQRLHHWNDPAQDLPPMPPAGAHRYSVKGLERLVDTLRRGTVVHQPVWRYPELVRAVLQLQQARSLVGVPILVGSEWRAALVLVDCATDRDWTSSEVEALRLSGAILGAAVQRQKVADALEESEAKYRILVEGADHSIVMVDDSGRLLFANGAACSALGLDVAEVVGRSIWDLFSPEDADRQIKTIWNALDSGVPVTRQASTTLGGRLRWYEARIRPLRGADGSCRQALVILSDISERKEAEDRILSYQMRLRALTSELSLTEQRERRRLASELHDSIGQSLAVSKIKLGALRKAALAEPHGRMLDEVWHLIDSTVQDVRTLTFRLSPPILNELGLEPALEWLVETFEKQHEIPATFHHDDRPKPLEADLAGLLFQSVQELLLNAAKHAQPNRVKVTARREEDRIRLEVEDDGRGFDPSQPVSSGPTPYGFGLFSIRERLGPLGGNVEVHSRPGQGTRVVLTAPLREEPGRPGKEEGAD